MHGTFQPMTVEMFRISRNLLWCQYWASFCSTVCGGLTSLVYYFACFNVFSALQYYALSWWMTELLLFHTQIYKRLQSKWKLWLNQFLILLRSLFRANHDIFTPVWSVSRQRFFSAASSTWSEISIAVVYQSFDAWLKPEK